jgi:hypothetical protein
MFISKFCAHLFYGIVVGALVLATGCSLAKFKQNEPLIQLSVQAATARVLHEKPEWVEDTLRITEEAMRFIDGQEMVDVGKLAEYVKAQVPWDKMIPEEQALVSTLMAVVQADIEKALAGKGVRVPEEEKVVVSKVLGWVRDMAMFKAT